MTGNPIRLTYESLDKFVIKNTSFFKASSLICSLKNKSIASGEADTIHILGLLFNDIEILIAPETNYYFLKLISNFNRYFTSHPTEEDEAHTR